MLLEDIFHSVVDLHCRMRYEFLNISGNSNEITIASGHWNKNKTVPF